MKTTKPKPGDIDPLLELAEKKADIDIMFKRMSLIKTRLSKNQCTMCGIPLPETHVTVLSKVIVDGSQLEVKMCIPCSSK